MRVARALATLSLGAMVLGGGALPAFADTEGPVI
jgi:hypothetical protein